MYAIYKNKLKDIKLNADKMVNYGEHLLALLLGAAELLDGCQDGVGVERPQDISEVEGVNLAAAVEVVDGEGEGCP